MQQINITYRDRVHYIRHHESIRLSSRLDMIDNRINFYGVEPPKDEPLKYGSNIADVSKGGTCNASCISLIPHCHGTHTECVGHISSRKHNIADLAFKPFIPATMIRVKQQILEYTGDTYNNSAHKDDRVITRQSIKSALAGFTTDYSEALIIVTDASDWLPDGVCAPYFTHQAMSYIVSLGVRHLLTDVPSIDRPYDGGQLDNHHSFWGVKETSIMDDDRSDCSITEMIQVPVGACAGHYFLSIHLPNLSGDALPSNPVLFPFSLRKV